MFRDGMSLKEFAFYLKVLRRPTPIRLTPYMKMTYFAEYDEWKKDYLPSWSLKGKTVLDVGAGCGETAYLFFGEGAVKVFCVEPDFKRFGNLLYNMVKMDWDAPAWNRGFKIADLMDLPIDYAKIDCEGCEMLLLNLEEDELPPLVVEIHHQEIYDEFKRKFPHMEIKPRRKSLWIGKFDKAINHRGFLE
jgi:SAM-dependent methyltransferase